MFEINRSSGQETEEEKSQSHGKPTRRNLTGVPSVNATAVTSPATDGEFLVEWAAY